ncbi:MAG: Sensory transduction histidine kinase [Cyanobacteria bacterium RYN_339]|nr:Sensory transduction histidine kinase [Cyanobacteria bacterium RYN_339]
MPAPRIVISPALRAFIAFIRADHLDEVARDYMRRIKVYDLPMLRLLAPMPEAEQVALNVSSLDGFLAALDDGTAHEVAAAGLRAWEADEIPGFSKHDFGPRDLILVGAAHEEALVAFLDRYTDDRAEALAIARELRAYYKQAELNAYEAFTRIRDDAVQHATRAEAAHEAALSALEETQALNEELVAQQEELNAVYGQLQEHSRLIEAEVARRTEELQAANEEMEAHHEELLAANDQLNHQASELAAQNGFVENLVKHVPTGIAYLDRALIFRWVNPEFASFAGLDVAVFNARSYYEVFPTMVNPNPRLLNVLESGETVQLTALELAHKDGSLSYWDIVYVPVFDGQGKVDGLMLMSQNATARVRNEQLQQQQIEQLHEIDRLKNDFLSILSHELRTPINAIMGFASILDDELAGPLNTAQHSYAQRILGGSDVLLALIEDLLDLSRMQAGKFSLSPAPFEPRELIEEALGSLSQLAQQRGQTVALVVASDLAPIVADPQRLRQVLTNLVGNAIKFGSDRDEIAVRVRMEPDGLYCEVEDHGEGIAEEDLPRLFQRFTQLDTGNTRKAGGAGLGLSIVKALVEAHGGTVGVRSEPGKCTVFWFRMPHQPVAIAAT